LIAPGLRNRRADLVDIYSKVSNQREDVFVDVAISHQSRDQAPLRRLPVLPCCGSVAVTRGVDIRYQYSWQLPVAT